MRVVLIAFCLISSAAMASAQTLAPDKPQDPSAYSTGRTVTPETKGQLQPQGWTGPIETTVGGAPAESPQGQSPPGMQAAPEGSSKTVVEPKK
jgi:hypothetical protein